MTEVQLAAEPAGTTPRSSYLPSLKRDCAVLATVKVASRRLWRLPSANLDLRCARRTFGR